MTKSLKEIIAGHIDRRWKKLIALGKYSKEVENQEEKDRVYLEMKKIVIDMEPVEHLVLEQNPQIREFWATIKEYEPEEERTNDGKSKQ